MKTINNYLAIVLFMLGASAMAQTPTISGDDMICPQGTGTLTTQTYDTYQWYRRYYGSSVTNPIPGETNQTLVMDYYSYAASYLSVEVTTGGNTYISAEYFVDGWVFASPVVMSSGDFSIGGTGQSILCPDDTMYFEFSDPYDTNIKWYKDGAPIAGANTQLLTVTEPGLYYVDGAPAVCPDFIQGPGVTLLVQELTFPAPTVTISGNYTVGTSGQSIICPGDSLFFDLNNPYNTNIKWYKDGAPISGETTQSLFVTEGGSYFVDGAPAACPNYIQGPSAPMVVEVLTFPAPVVTPAGPFDLGPDGQYIICTGEVMTFTLSDPFNANISWYQSGVLLSGETNQLLEVNDSGTYTALCAPAACPDYIKDANVNLVVEFCDLGLNDQNNGVAVNVYPNPTTSMVTISVPADNSGMSYRLIDLSGKTIMEGILTNQQNVIDLQEYSNGAYPLFVNGQFVRIIHVIRN